MEFSESDLPVPDKEQRMWAMLCHLTTLTTYIGIPGFVGPLIIWLLKKDEMPFVNDQGKESLNFQISLTLYAIISAILICVVVGFALLIATIAFGVVMAVVASIKANEGVAYRYPLTIRLIS